MIIWESGGALLYKMYAPDGSVFGSQTTLVAVPDPYYMGYLPSAAFDSSDRVAISFTAYVDPDATGLTSYGVYLMECSLGDMQDAIPGGPTWYAIQGPDVRNFTRVNSASFDTTSITNWAETQYGGQIVMDADGDMTVAYSGFGPDVSETDIDQLLKTTLIARQTA